MWKKLNPWKIGYLGNIRYIKDFLNYYLIFIYIILSMYLFQKSWYLRYLDFLKYMFIFCISALQKTRRRVLMEKKNNKMWKKSYPWTMYVRRKIKRGWRISQNISIYGMEDRGSNQLSSTIDVGFGVIKLYGPATAWHSL